MTEATIKTETSDEGWALHPDAGRLPSFEELVAEHERVQAERDEARQKLADVEAEVQRMDERLAGMREQLMIARCKRDEARTKLKTMSGERDEARTELETLRGEHAEACGTVARLTQERDLARIEREGWKETAAKSVAVAARERGLAEGLREALRLMIAGRS